MTALIEDVVTVESITRSRSGAVLRSLRTRGLQSIPTILIVLFISLTLIDLMPGDAAATVAGQDATPQQIAVIRDRLGLNESVPTRMWNQIEDLAHGDLGQSLITNRPVSTTIREAMPATASVALVALVLTAVVGIVAGTIAAIRRGTRVDSIINSAAALALAVPAFVVALVLVVVFALQRGWFPATGYTSIAHGGVSGWLKSVWLPGVALSLNSAAELTRQVRGAMVDTFEQDYIRTARATGLRRRAVIFRHALRNAAVPIITVYGLQLGRIIGGAVVVEQVFAIPGFGTLAFQAVLQRDIPTIQGAVLVTALVIVVVNLLTDVILSLINPKLREA